jgi:hypothetical protein
MTLSSSIWTAVAATAFSASVASAQSGLLSATATVSLSAVKQAALSVTVNSGATQTLASLTDNAINSFSTPVNITTAWDLHPSTSALVLVGYFTTPTQALSNGTNYIASSLVRGRLGTVGAFNPFSGAAIAGGSSTAGVAGGTLALFSTNINGTNKVSSRTDDLYLQINLVGQTTTPGTYTGTLTLRAITQ